MAGSGNPANAPRPGRLLIDGPGVGISAAILRADLACLAEAVTAAEEGGATAIHVDVMDGVFAPLITFGHPVIEAVARVSTVAVDVHLQVQDPEPHVEGIVAAGADAVTVHYESNANVHRTLARIRRCGAQAGIAVNPATPLGAIKDVVEAADVVVVMTVDPGTRDLIPWTIPKIREAAELTAARNPSAIVAVDGGVTADTAAQFVAEGARLLIAASAAYRSGPPRDAVAELCRLAAAVREES
jgi:ribulose-phosphate 3-epimerase